MSVTRGYQVYKAKWTPMMNQKLLGKEDQRAKAKGYNQFVVGIFKPMDYNTLLLVEHVPTELSCPLFHFFKKN